MGCASSVRRDIVELRQQVEQLQENVTRLKAGLKELQLAAQSQPPQVTAPAVQPTNVPSLNDAPVEGGKESSVALDEVHSMGPVSAATNAEPQKDNNILIREYGSNGDVQGVQKMLDAGVDPNWVDENGQTALWQPVHWDQLDVIQLLLQQGAKADLGDEDNAPIVCASKSGKAETAMQLLKAGAKASTLDSSGVPAFHYIVQNFDINAVKAALPTASGVINLLPPEFGNTPLTTACSAGQLDVVKLLLSAGAKPTLPNSKGRTPLFCAAQCGQDSAAPLVEVLLGAGASVTEAGADGRTALHGAVNEGSVALARVLLAAGSNANGRFKHVGSVPVRNVDTEDDTLLHVAVVRTQPDQPTAMAKLLMQYGADKNARNKDGNTPLHFAVYTGNLGAVQALIAAGADACVKNSDGQTPLHLAVQLAAAAATATPPMSASERNSLQMDMHDFLINRAGKPGWDFREQNRFAAMQRKLAEEGARVFYPLTLHPEELLDYVSALTNGAVDVNVTNSGGQTPLHIAVQHNMQEVSTLLLDRNADMTVADSSGNTPLDIARAGGNFKLVKLLQDRRATLMQQRNADSANCQVFISFRVAEAMADCRALKAALEARGVQYVFACEGISNGADWAEAISYALNRCKVFVILGTETYGVMNAGGMLSTADEFRFAREKKKALVLAKMCSEYKAELAAISLPAIMHIEWTPGTPPPEALLLAVETKLKEVDAKK